MPALLCPVTLLGLQMDFKVLLKGLDEFAHEFWELVEFHKVFAFHGEMGVGKTTIITALCRIKGSADVMSSPTYSIINEYSFIEEGKHKIIYHIDLYRLKDDEEVMQAGVEDCIYGGDICLVEWPEKAAYLFDRGTVHVFIEAHASQQRLVRVKLP